MIADGDITENLRARANIDAVAKRWMTARLAVSRRYHLRPLNEHAILSDAPVNDDTAKVVDHESRSNLRLERDANAADRLRDLVENEVEGH
jgi:hypothetical protein